MKRRDFIKKSAAGIVMPTMFGSVGVRALANSPMLAALNSATDTDKVLVLIYLNGGNDGLNTVVPLDQYGTLTRVRPDVILPENSLLHLNNSDVGLHPSMTGFKELYDEGRLQIIQNVGYPGQDYSHFRSTDIWMSGSASDQIVNNGMAGRYLDYEFPNYPIDYPNESAPDPLAIEVGYSSSLIFQGPALNMGMVINNADEFYELVAQPEPPVPDSKAGEQLEYIRLIKRQSQVYGEAVVNAASQVTEQGEYPDTQLAQELKIISRLIAGGLQTRLYMVQLGGFDTHDNQVMANDHTEGEHANLLKQLTDAVAAFMRDLDGLGVSDRVSGMTFSEFGRRIVSNASLGTDHGAAAPLFIFGNHVNGGVVGSNPEIPTDATYADNIEWKYDFRNVYASMFAQWFCVPESDLDSVFLESFDPLNIINGDQCNIVNTHEYNQQTGRSLLNVMPNRTRDITHIEFESNGGVLSISLIDVSGRKLMDIVRSNYPSGKHKIQLNLTTFPPGIYFVLFQQRDLRQAKKVIKV